ncbi:MAG: M1 family metallopeptidase [Theionarchaea archaeon]|nr:M1 family metallopeptidase [Theionarchaea archaeon]
MRKTDFLVVLVLVGGCLAQSPGEDPEQGHTADVSRLFEVSWDDYRLFDQGLIASEQGVNHLLNATGYHIDLHISEGYLSLQGHEEVRYTNTEDEPLHEVYFRLFPNSAGGTIVVSSVMVNAQNVEPHYEYNGSALRKPLEEDLLPGERVMIEMDFTVEIPQELGGNYGLFGYFNDVLVLDEGYPVIPVYDEGGWHVEIPPPHGDKTYLDASFYLVRVTAPADLIVAASGIEVGRQVSGSEQILAFAAGPARDFYLAASERFVVTTKIRGGTTIKSYAFEERRERAEMALQIAGDALEQFSARFGSYPYTEFDIVSTPMLAKGMEYPGIVAISQRLYDPDEVISGLPSAVMLESIVAHEVAHQWFYNVVGNDQVNEPWLDEAAAQYVTGLYYEDVHGEEASQEYRESWDYLWGLVYWVNIPIGLPSGAYTGEEYQPIVYGRGPLFFMQVAETLGPEFGEFLREYYESHKWGIGTAEAFRQQAEEHCQCDLTVLFKEWVT